MWCTQADRQTDKQTDRLTDLMSQPLIFKEIGVINETVPNSGLGSHYSNSDLRYHCCFDTIIKFVINFEQE
jgi:hypothetical protein